MRLLILHKHLPLLNEDKRKLHTDSFNIEVALKDLSFLSLPDHLQNVPFESRGIPDDYIM